MFTYIIDGLLVALGAAMLLKGHYGITRQSGFMPLATAALDAAFVAQLDLSLTPWLSAVVILLQLTVLGANALLFYKDAVCARNKQARRRRRQEVARSRAAFEQALDRRQQTATRRRVCA